MIPHDCGRIAGICKIPAALYEDFDGSPHPDQLQGRWR